MQKIVLLLAGLFTVNQAVAGNVYRPYASCISPSQKTTIDIRQNVDAKDTDHGYLVSIVHSIRGNKVSLVDQNAVKDPIDRKGILELLVSYGNKPTYGFSLLVTTQSPLNMDGQYKAYFTDLLGTSVVYCSHHVTFGN